MALLMLGRATNNKRLMRLWRGRARATMAGGPELLVAVPLDTHIASVAGVEIDAGGDVVSIEADGGVKWWARRSLSLFLILV